MGLSYKEFRRGAVPQHYAATLWAAPVVRARTAERTQTPAATWSGISDDALRTTSPEISTPLLTGPGCITSAPLSRWRRDTPKNLAYSTTEGIRAPIILSFWSRSM